MYIFSIKDKVMRIDTVINDIKEMPCERAVEIGEILVV